MLRLSTREEKRAAGVQSARPNFVASGHEDAPLCRQQDSPDGITTPLTISALMIQDIEETTPETTPLTDREKRCLAVPIGDLHDDKKLLRTRSISSRPM